MYFHQHGECVRSIDGVLNRNLIRTYTQVRNHEYCQLLCNLDKECVAFYIENRHSGICYTLKKDKISRYTGGRDKGFSCYIKSQVVLKEEFGAADINKDRRLSLEEWSSFQ